MRDLRRRFPNPNALLSFESAGRLGSFTDAAEELGLTQAAISYSVKLLEKDLGIALFHRRHRLVELTDSGRKFHADVTSALQQIARSADSLRYAASDRVTVDSSTAFASHWMIPRIPAIRSQYPDIDIRLLTSDRDVEIGRDPTLIGIRRGNGNWSDYQAVMAVDEIIIPVCSPAYLSQHPDWLEERSERTLIHLEEPYRPRPTWQDWFNHFDVAYTDRGEGLRLNDYSLVVQAAIGGQGVALGWRHIVEHAVQRRLLVEASDMKWRTGMAFYAVTHKAVEPSPDTKRIMDWIVNELNELQH
ncbi:MAG: LysR family transcriptional regulator [Mesorhizobium sp.]|uniref:LysR substrate-binding domain-containing protein n=1 Tax=Mesorhizobium sp. TaxID=1871066 RepID=UPI00120615FC|nr:LysR substrate-binding domain-containing protein [Mesorhizobium sp.]TIT21048.1 MAG: LysR family transcriptional regulator [Mesorhizobium sp.]TIX69208.1 MAG: LysR family transcriptional regulator [Mesorhizobium sp.]